MFLKNSLAKVYHIMLTPTTGLYKASKGCESTCNFIITEGELKRITSPMIKINSLITSLRNFKSSEIRIKIPRLLGLNNLMIKCSITKIIKEIILNFKHPFRIWSYLCLIS